MKIKHKLLADYQYITPDKKIFLIKSGTIIEEYTYKLKGEFIPVDKEIVEANPQLFDPVDWKAELLTFMRAEKMPQPAQLGKKLIPFFEEMIMSSIQQNAQTTDPSVVRELERKESELNSIKKDLERKESDLNSKERRLKDLEDDSEVRTKRIEKREDEYKADLSIVEKKSEELRSKTRDLTEKEIELNEKIQELNEKERNLDRDALKSAKEIDEKYVKLQDKINEDLKELSKKEKELESESKRVKDLESEINNKMDEIVELNKSKIYADLENDLIDMDRSVNSLNSIANMLTEFNHPVISQSGSEIIKIVKSLRNKIDNNLMN